MRIFNHGDNSWFQWIDFFFMLPEIFGCQIGWVLHFGPFATPGWRTLGAEAVQSLPHSALRSPSASDSIYYIIYIHQSIRVVGSKHHIACFIWWCATAVSPKNESCCRMLTSHRLFPHHELEIAMWRDPSSEQCLDEGDVNFHDLPDWNNLRLFWRIFGATQTLYQQTMAATIRDSYLAWEIAWGPPYRCGPLFSIWVVSRCRRWANLSSMVNLTNNYPPPKPTP